MAADALYVEDLSVSFDGFKALDIKQFILGEKELRVVIGPNGAGKTTFLDVLCGKTKPDTGSAKMGTFELTQMSEKEIVEAGIGRKFQAPTIFSSLSVYENLLLAKKNPKGVFSSLFYRNNQSDQTEIERILDLVGLQSRAQDLAGALSHGQKQWLEIGMVIIQDPLVMLVDEPAAGMTDEETFKTGELLQSLANDRAIIVIEHDMAFVKQIARKVTVLHEGKVLMEGSMEEVQNDERVIECYLGSAKRKKGHA